MGICGEIIVVGMEARPGGVTSTTEHVQAHQPAVDCPAGKIFEAFPHRRRVVSSSKQLKSHLLMYFWPDYTGFVLVSVGVFFPFRQRCLSFPVIHGLSLHHVKQMFVGTHIITKTDV